MKFICLFSILLFSVVSISKAQEYELGEDSFRQEGVPSGKVTKYIWESPSFQNFREYYVYVPAQYDASKPAALMVFQDGHAYVDTNNDWRVPIVFDNLIAKGQMPVTIGLFITPGHPTKDFPENRFRNANRANEYDELNDLYVTMLLDELIPELKKTLNISENRKMHAICGLSSGAICAWTAAWQRPDYFHKVLSHIGSFTNIRGGHHYPFLIRKSAPKDIKIYLQDGSNDLNNIHGDWYISNLQMASALRFKNYDLETNWGTGGHDGKHGGAILAESLKWLWSDVIQ
ncbi:alpha/beta hydrolase [Jiulongibacter sediminis]|uniref:Esterase n=1 Tax=Jiulongibacter sediminis TaxID=1605367 RepID=A0A0P7BRX2_9BACT|nr:alpha/beta hydrolase-fold protein [Jiulongibacter sediminis]KPM50117.1 esterase [Jiulongibacter sediminis]TBX27137.1 esterase [Jiulongibacter sediminis]